MMRQLEVKQPFNLERSLMMGQAFRWRPLGDGWFSGVIGENLVRIRQTNDGVEYRVGGADGERTATSDDDELLLRYFREDDDVAAIYDHLRQDVHIAQLTEQHCGMRLLRQEPWECMVSYICSANNNIPRISGIVEAIAKSFGSSIKLAGDIRHTFPAATELAADEAKSEKLASLNLGLKRDEKIIAASQRVCDGALNLCSLRQQPYAEVMRTLMQGNRHSSKANGIGPKIADCIALMSLDKTEAFPVDTHIRRAMNEIYFQAQKPPSDAKIVRWAQEHFGPYAGYAGQFLFCDQPK